MSFSKKSDQLNVRDAANQIKHARKAVSEFKKLLTKLNKSVDVESFSSKAKLKKHLATNSQIGKYIDTYMGTLEEAEGDDKVRNNTLNMFTRLLFEAEPLEGRDEEALYRYAEAGFEYKLLFVVQAPVRKALPKEIRRFLPRNIVFDLDDAGNITAVRDRIGNQLRDLQLKHEIMVDMISNYNDLVDDVKADMKSPYEDLRLSAILTAIMMESGIRPGAGKLGTTKKYDANGNEVQIATFGVTTLRPSHIKDFREDFVKIVFPGKAGVENVAELTNQELIEALTPYLEKAQKSVNLGGEPADEPPIFMGLNGFQYHYNYLNKYIKSKLGNSGLEPRDFRMLRATQTFYLALEEKQVELHKTIKALVKRGVANVKELVAEEISNTFAEAIAQASSGLSHVEQENTINYYVSPMVALNFISQGYIEKNIEKAILKGFDTISFNVDKFIEIAKTHGTKKYPVGKTAGVNLLELMEDLDNSLGERTSGTNLLELMEDLDSSLGKID